MTIDEAIEDFKTMAKNARNDIIDSDDLEPQEKHYNSQFELYAKEKEQIAEWLEELKELRKIKEDYAKGMQTSYATFMYNKALDDYKYFLIERLEAGRCIDEKFAYIDLCDIDEIAEQLKAGGLNERF